MTFVFYFFFPPFLSSVLLFATRRPVLGCLPFAHCVLIANLLQSFRTVTLSSPMAFSLSAPCCAQLRHHAISTLSDRFHFAYASSCHTVSVRKATEPGEAMFVIAEEPSVVALEGDELATANIYTCVLYVLF